MVSIKKYNYSTKSVIIICYKRFLQSQQNIAVSLITNNITLSIV